jgi:hypothetical protein
MKYFSIINDNNTAMTTIKILLGEGARGLAPKTYAKQFRNPYCQQKRALQSDLGHLLEFGIRQFAAAIFFGQKELVEPKLDLKPRTEITRSEIVEQLVKRNISPTLFGQAIRAIEAQLLSNYTLKCKFEVHLTELATEELSAKGKSEADIQRFYRLTSAEKVDFLIEIGVVKKLNLEPKDFNCGLRQPKLFPVIPLRPPRT